MAPLDPEHPGRLGVPLALNPRSDLFDLSPRGPAPVTCISRPALVAGLAYLSRFSAITHPAPITCLSGISRLARLTNLPLWSGWPRNRRGWGVVAPANK